MKLVDMWRFLNVVPNNKGYGVEIEMEGRSLPNRVENIGWRCTADGSLRGEAIEYVLTEPLSLDEANEAVVNLYGRFNSNRNSCIIDPSDRCGVHVHRNCQHFSIEQIFNIITLSLIVEDTMVHWCGEDREGNLFCLRASDAEFIPIMLMEAKRRGDVSRLFNDRMRYASVNIASLGKYGTLEYRALRTPLTPYPILQWMDMIDRLVNYAISHTSEELIIGLSAMGADAYLKDIFGEELAELLQVHDPMSEQRLMDSVRRMQAVAFTPYRGVK